MFQTPRFKDAFALAMLSMLAMASTGGAEILHVPDDESTIQSAIDRAQDGDMVVVAAGTWNETINLKGKDIVLRSADGPDLTVLDGSGLPGSIVYCVGGERRSTRIEGFTLRGGTGDSSIHGPGKTIGGAMYITGSSPLVNDCIFEANHTVLQGGAVYSAREAHPSFQDCRFTQNESEKGGAVFSLLSNPRFENCRFDHNLARFSGGAVFNSNRCAPKFISCDFEKNLSLYNGGAIYDYESHGSLSRCTFSRNAASFRGGAIYSGYRSDAVLAECLFTTPSDDVAGRKGVVPASILQRGACCLGEGCIIAEQVACIDAGGSFVGQGSVCEDTITHCDVSVKGDLDGDGDVDRKDMAVLMMLWK
ncbi:MAG: right-handed parallel beta-helix repeat-containing protein [Phycisphaerales bacterium]|nr:right-handed parallel beta-helix repeat-containing protein [Phycisphaerales bacterium]